MFILARKGGKLGVADELMGKISVYAFPGQSPKRVVLGFASTFKNKIPVVCRQNTSILSTKYRCFENKV